MPTNTQTRDIETLLHPYTDLAGFRETGPMVIERGQGVHVWDTEGNRYIEGMGGLWCTALGYGHPEMVEAATKQMETLSFAHLFGGKSHEPAIELAERLKAIAPCPASKVFFTSSGSEANDTQIKLAWYVNNARGQHAKKKIVSRMRAYHGVTIATASLTGLPANHMDFDLPLPGMLHTDCPHHYRFAQAGETQEDFATRMAASLEALILREGPDTIAAFIAEPLMGAGGVIVPPATYFQKVQAVLARYDIALIADEVICGFARTGEMFGSTAFGMTPDTVTLAKAITSGYAPLGALTVPEETYAAMVDQSEKIGVFGHGYTYTGHPLATALGCKALEIYERDNILGHVQAIAPGFQAHLARLGDHPLVGEARGVGLIGGLELVADKQTRAPFDPAHKMGQRLAALVQKDGVIVRPLGDTLAICPPLVITSGQIDEIFGAVARALDALLDVVTREGLGAA